MNTWTLPLVVALAVLAGWHLAPPEPAPRPNPRIDTSAYAIVWQTGGACADAAPAAEDTAYVPRCGNVGDDVVTPR